MKVTSLSYRNFWFINNKKNENWYFVLVFQPENKPSEFSLLTPDEMRKEKRLYLSSRKPLSEYSNPEMEEKGLSFDQRENYKDNWNSLPNKNKELMKAIFKL